MQVHGACPANLKYNMQDAIRFFTIYQPAFKDFS